MVTDFTIRGTWSKNWVGNWGMLFLSWYGEIYTKSYKKSLGKAMKQVILYYDEKAATNFLNKEDLEQICKYLAAKVKSDPKIAHKWCEELKSESDRMMKLMDRLDKQADFSLKDLNDLSDCMHAQNPPNFAIKKVVDYLPKDLADKYLEEFREARLYCEPVYNRTEAVIEKWNKIVERKTKISSELVRCLVHDEMEAYLKTGILPKLEMLKDRQKGSLMMYENGNVKIITGKNAQTYLEKITKPENRGEVKGTPAFSGIAKGVARIIHDPRKVKRFNSGDILIAGMTRPEFLPIMKKAAGFVTDAGGMLCHAAIVARELKKPCIVGTENATKIFKDGDLIEVDATKGIVRKLE